MAKKRKHTFGEDLDWYLIPIEKVKKFVLIIILLAVGALAVYLGTTYFQSPKTKARIAIKKSQEMADRISQLTNFAELRTEYVEIQTNIQEAQNFYNTNQYPEAMAKSKEASSAASRILNAARGEERNPDAKIMRLEGKVELQRRGQGIWESAKPRDDLFEGDFVKTGKNGAAEITVGNIVLKLGSDTLYEVTSKREGIEGGKPKIRMVMGEINIFTQSTGAGVETPALFANLNQQTVAEITTDSQKGGSATILGGEGGTVQIGEETTNIGERERLQVAGNRVVNRTRVLPSPPILSPADNRSFSSTSREGVRLEWGRVEGALKYHVQISKTQFFTKLLDYGDFTRTKTFVQLKITAVGDYYWRVAGVDEKGQDGVYSVPKKFRLVPPSDLEVRRAEPPKIDIGSIEVIARVCVIKGIVESGAHVEINGEKVEIKPDGSFTHVITFNSLGMNEISIKASNASGGETVVRKQVLIEEY
ncbi:MAG TPA: hypothetical protein PK014_10330 [Thermoanaerobaculia bacterium]|nr:hypothetical protein [Thermoanaerobaculia bacterium]HUM30516.1 hypothetical protein [Thermoanaerobaculia bacterium]HXK68708.1 hypothetical protein [Thermoanaerobaculia bacterium]